MPKAERGTPKDLANRMKAKGLQKLRWYCQMCEKQCRDENGFKCHTSSESHQRQLLLFADNPNRYLDQFSQEFKTGYVELLRRRFGTKRVNANQVYQEYISEKTHLHMNATKWLTLTEFVKYLGREGIATVDETEKGWYVTWIDRDPETIFRQQQLAKKEKLDKDDDERMLEFIEKQVERNKGKEESTKPQYTELVRKSEDEKVFTPLNLGGGSSSSASSVASSVLPSTSFLLKGGDSKRPSSFSSASSVKSSSSSSAKRKSALEEIKEEQERINRKKFRKDYWLMQGIVVKIMTRRLGEDFYKAKGVVLQVIDKYTAVVRTLNSGTKLKIDQEHLETVIPQPNREVLIVNGEYRGSEGVVKSVDMDKISASITITSGTYSGKTIKEISFEDFSKLHKS